MKAKQIALTDADGAVRYFDAEDLSVQLLAADLMPPGAAKLAAKNLAGFVRELRKEQKNFFSAAYNSPERTRALNKSKYLEGKVDNILKAFDVTVDRL